MRSLPLLLLLTLMTLTPALPAAEDEAEAPAKALYFKLTPSLIVNLQGKGHYLRGDIQLMTRDEESLSQLTLHQPAIRHELLLLMSDQPADTLKGAKGKEKLRKDALKAVRTTLKALTGKEIVEDLYFTSFFVQ